MWLNVRNCAEALPRGIKYLLSSGVSDVSRNGPTIRSITPVVTAYSHPWECVLLNAVRDANPFFHMMEALWMLSGADDASFLNTYIKDFGFRFAEANGLIHGSYGHRWRYHFGFDQLQALISKAKEDPNSRQLVLQMWDPKADLTTKVKDRPCNQSVTFRKAHSGCLDMTVYCRSNDIVMGAYGANAVHFNFLHQYVCAMLGLSQGKYYQMSNDYHVYLTDLEQLSIRAGRDWDQVYYEEGSFLDALAPSPCPPGLPLVSNPDTFDDDLAVFMSQARDGEFNKRGKNNFLNYTAEPMVLAHKFHKQGKREAAALYASIILSEDWKLAAIQWLERRYA